MATLKEITGEAHSLISALKDYYKDLKNGKVEQMIAKEYAHDIANDIKYIFDMYVQKYYDAYNPKYYESKRKYRLFDMYEIQVNGTNVVWHVGPSLDQYPVYERFKNPQGGGEYMFHYMFELGFHGGANSGPPDAYGIEFFGSNENLLWRYPVPSQWWTNKGLKPYSLWGNFAKRTFSPSNRIEIDLQNYQNGKRNISGTTLSERYDEAWEYVIKKYPVYNMLRGR